MLNKDVCKNCWKKEMELFREKLELEKKKLCYWNEKHDIDWKDGYVLCPMGLSIPYMRVNESPRKECKYKLEHIMKSV